MKIGWVEDDYANLLDGVKLLVKLLDDLYATRLINYFDTYEGDDYSPETIAKLFQENSMHNLEWVESYSEMRGLISCDNSNRWDVVILDLNLEKGFDAKKHKSVSSSTAGFALYIQLLNAGFPAKHIVFSTNNASQTQKLEQMCDAYDIPKPRYFEKVRPGQLIDWLRERLVDSRLTLRRGVLDGCSYMMSRLLDDPQQSIRINQCCASGSDEVFLNTASLKDWLEAWPKLLPRPVSSEDSGENNEYAVFLLALLTMWDGKVGIPVEKQSASNNNALAQALRSARKTSSEVDGNEGFSVIPHILKWARNWIAHSNSLHDSTLHAAAFFFLLAGRGLLCIAFTPLRHEQLLLQLIGGQRLNKLVSNFSDRELLSIKADLFDAARSSVESAGVDIRQPAYKDKKRPPYFNQMANDYVKNSPRPLAFRYLPEELSMLSLLIDTRAQEPTVGGFVSELCIALKNHLRRSSDCPQG